MNRNAKTALLASTIVVAMTGLTAASVPLYQLFCQVTGYGGTPMVDGAGSTDVVDRTVTVRFNADKSPLLPWSFQPLQRTVDVKLGEERLAFYTASNLGEEPIVGSAVFNVAPFKVGSYFSKIDCFCFEEQLLEPGQSAEMPVSFFVDPEMARDINTMDVENITLSYTFYIDEEATEALREERRKTANPPELHPEEQPVQSGDIKGKEKIHG